MNVNINKCFTLLQQEFFFHKNEESAIKMAAYMKNKFPFFGINSPDRKKVQKTFYKSFELHEKDYIDFAKLGFSFSEREMHYFTIDFFAKQKNRNLSNEIQFFEYLITTNSWWDSVDTICGQIISPFFEKNKPLQNDCIKKWCVDKNIWLRRSAIIAQLKMKEFTDVELLKFAIENNLNSTEFFINKAIGWALREYAKTNKNWVKDYVSKTELSNLSKREALKHIL